MKALGGGSNLPLMEQLHSCLELQLNPSWTACFLCTLESLIMTPFMQAVGFLRIRGKVQYKIYLNLPSKFNKFWAFGIRCIQKREGKCFDVGYTNRLETEIVACLQKPIDSILGGHDMWCLLKLCRCPWTRFRFKMENMLFKDEMAILKTAGIVSFWVIWLT